MSAVLAFVVSIAVALVCHRWLPRSLARRYALPVAVAAGFLAGYSLLPQPAAWLPTRYWHWLPYIAMAAALLGPVAYARGIWPFERFLITGLVAVVAALLLVPTWSALEPVRKNYVVFLTVYLLTLVVCLTPLVVRARHRIILPILGVTSTVLAVLILASVSIGLGQLAGNFAVAVVGICLVGIWSRDSFDLPSLAVVFAIVAGSLAFVGYIDPDPKLTGMLLIPASPLSLWIVALIPFREDSRLRAIAQGSVFAITIGAVSLAVLFAE